MGNVHIHINTGGASSPAQKKPSSASKAGNGNAAPQRAKATGLGAATRPQQQAQPAYPQSQMVTQLPPQQQAPVVPTPTRASTPSGVANKKNTHTPASAASVSPKQMPKASSPAASKGKSTSSVKKVSSPSSSTSSSSSSSKSSSGSNKSANKAQPQSATKASATPKAQQTKTLGMQQQPGMTPAGPPQAGSLLGGNGGNFMPGAGQLPPTASSPQPTQGAQNMKPPIAKSPGKEPKAPPDVETARDQQDTVLRQRQAREVQGRLRGGPRDVDAGSGFWPPMTPVL